MGGREYTGLMAYKPLKFTEEGMAENIKRLGTLPKEVIEMYGNREEDPAPCIAACESILAIEPTHGVANLYMAKMALEREDYKTVLRHATVITKRMPLIFAGWQLRGMAELMLHKPEAARKSFMRYGEFKSDDPWPMCLIAMTYYAEREIGAALYVLDVASKGERIKDKRMLLWVRAIVEEKAGDTHAALSHLIEFQMMADGELKDEAARKIHKLLFLEEKADD